jgi:hypothetical protein
VVNAAAFRAFLDEAHAALNGADAQGAQDAERRAKAVSALVRAERDVAEYLSELRAASENDNEDAISAELQRRLAAFADADRAGHPPEILASIATTGSAR